MGFKPNLQFLAAAVVLAAAAFADANAVDAPLARAQEKFARALRIVEQFNDEARARGFDGDGWRFEMLARLMRGPAANIAAVGMARTFADAMSASGRAGPVGSPPPGTLVPASLGDAFDDLVYVPIVPCRILDTRGHGGPLAAGSSQDYFYYPGNPGSGNCSVTGQIPGGGSPAAIAVNVTVDETGLSGFAAGSFLQLFPQGGSTTTSFLNFGPGQIIANAGIITIDEPSGQFTLYTSAPAQVIVDIYGVFIEPVATALDCNNGQQASTTLPANGHVALVSKNCQAGYALTGGMCSGGDAASTYLKESRMAIPGADPTTSYGWFCAWISKNASVQTVYANPRCCRVPGR